jgi:hypothetical protein
MSVESALVAMNFNVENLRLYVGGLAVFDKDSVVNTLTWMKIRKHNPFGLHNRKHSNSKLVETHIPHPQLARAISF